MGGFVGGQIRFHDHDNIEQIGKLFMPQRHLVNARLYIFVNRRGLQVLRRNVPVIKLLSILTAWTTPSIRAIIRENTVLSYNAALKSNADLLV